MSTEQKAKLSEATKRQWLTSDPRTGRRHSDEIKQKISDKVQASLAAGGGGHFIPSKRTRKMMSDSLKGNQNAKGAIRTPEQCEAMRQRMLGRPSPMKGTTRPEAEYDSRRHGVTLTSADGVVTAYASITELRKDTGLFAPTVNRALKSGLPLKKGQFKGCVFAPT